MINNALLSAMAEVGVMPASKLTLPVFGVIKRFQVIGDRNGSLNGWIIAFYEQAGEETFIFGNWKAGSKHIYNAHKPCKHDHSTNLKIDAQIKLANCAKQELQMRAATESFNIWEKALPAKTHSYLTSKSILPHIAKIDSKNRLLIPLVSTDNCISSLQFISSNGRKTFMKDGQIKGCYCPLGYEKNANVILICEGFATGATLREATNLGVIVAFNAGNLLPVAEAIRLENPTSRIVICADNDHLNERINIGLVKSEEAAKQAGAFMISPNFEADDLGSDFNDFAKTHGIDTVKALILGALS